MIVDDSAVMRGLLARVLRQTEGIEVVASVFNGAMAVEEIERTPADVILPRHGNARDGRHHRLA